MSRWFAAPIAALVCILALIILAAPAAVAEPPPADPPTQGTANDFLPPDRDLDECISSLPQPGCGSESRSGWRQWLVLAVIVAGLAFIAWRVIRAARRHPRMGDR